MNSSKTQELITRINVIVQLGSGQFVDGMEQFLIEKEVAEVLSRRGVKIEKVSVSCSSERMDK